MVENNILARIAIKVDIEAIFDLRHHILRQGLPKDEAIFIGDTCGGPGGGRGCAGARGRGVGVCGGAGAPGQTRAPTCGGRRDGRRIGRTRCTGRVTGLTGTA